MNRNRYLCTALVLLGLTALALNSSLAQAAATPEPEALAQTTTLWGLIKQGGWTMFPLGLLSIAMVALTVYGFLSVREDKMLHLELLPQLQDAVRRLDLNQASAICVGVPSLLTNVLNAGLMRTADGLVEVPNMEKAMEEAAVEETAAALKPINYLSIIAQIAPMLGLLGTVSGMIKAFQKIGLGGMGDPEALAADIGEAMITTATGLIIGIPAMFFYFYLKNRFSAHVSRLGRVLGSLTHQLQAGLSRDDARVIVPSGQAPSLTPTAAVEVQP